MKIISTVRQRLPCSNVLKATSWYCSSVLTGKAQSCFTGSFATVLGGYIAWIESLLGAVISFKFSPQFHT